MRKKHNLAIWGWWQGNNLGDNWIKRTLSKIFPNADFIPTSVHDFASYDFVICGGGGLFIYDVIFPWNQSENIKVSFGILGLGAEFEHQSSIAAGLEKTARFFFVRDQYSIDCMHLSQQARSFDITFFSPLRWAEESTINQNKLFFVWRDGRELLENRLFNEYICSDEHANEKWISILSSFFSDIVYDDFQTEDADIEHRLSDAGFVVSGRYHGIVAAIQRGLPFIAIDICPKIRALTQEVGLEQYCIKQNEYFKLNELITDAFHNIVLIRTKEKNYLRTATQSLKHTIRLAKKEVYKTCKPFSGIHYGSYWMGENDIVNTMSDDLGDISRLKKIDLRQYSADESKHVLTKMRMPNTNITVLKHKQVMRDVKKFNPDFIVLNSGGLILEDKTFDAIRKMSIKILGLEMSDPDVFPYNGNLWADKFDYYYTNSLYSYEKQYDHSRVSIRKMPFAASVSHHYYMPEVERIYDVVIVGHARPDRIAIVNKLDSRFKVGTYGSGWSNSLGTVNGRAHTIALNSGYLYLSFAQTSAGYENIKVGLFEAIACKQVVITKYMAELEQFFDIGTEVLCYDSEDEIPEIIKYCLNHKDESERIRERAYHRFLSEHTYVDRWINVFEDIGL